MSQVTFEKKKSGTESASPTGDLSEEVVFEMLSNRRRRYALDYLRKRETGTPVELRDIAEHIGARENEKPIGELTSAECYSVKNSLHQFHFPKLEENGFVEYDSQRGTVLLTDRAARFDVYVEAVSKWDVPWGQYYLGLAAINASIVAAAWFATPPSDGVTWLPVAVFFVATLAVSGLVHSYYSQSRTRLGTYRHPARGRDDGQ